MWRIVGLAAAIGGCGFAIVPASPDDGRPPDVLDSSLDDAPLDRTGFDPATDCPPDYLVQLASTAMASRYRVISTIAAFWPLETACAADRASATHLVSLDDMTEVVELHALLDATQAAGLVRFYIGAVQDPAATAHGAGWIRFTGEPLLQTAWLAGQPDDSGDGIENGGQQLIVLDRETVYFHDAVGVSPYGAVCECDGRPTSPTARAFVDADPNNPN